MNYSHQTHTFVCHNDFICLDLKILAFISHKVHNCDFISQNCDFISHKLISQNVLLYLFATLIYMCIFVSLYLTVF